MAMSPTWRRAAKTPRRRPERLRGVTPPTLAQSARAAREGGCSRPRSRRPSRGIADVAGCPSRRRLTPRPPGDSIRGAMARPQHIYASTVDRRHGRRWNRRRALWPFALGAVAALAAVALLAAALLG